MVPRFCVPLKCGIIYTPAKGQEWTGGGWRAAPRSFLDPAILKTIFSAESTPQPYDWGDIAAISTQMTLVTETGSSAVRRLF